MGLLLNGTTDRLDWATAPVNVAGTFSFACWLWQGEPGANADYLFTFHRSGDAAMAAYLYSSATSPGIINFTRAGSNQQSNQILTGISLCAWHHIGFSITGANAVNIDFFIDGVPVACQDTDDGTGAYASDGSFSLGGRIYDDTRNVNGMIARPAFWSRALSESEFAFLANGGLPEAVSMGLAFAPPLLTDYLDPVTGRTGVPDEVDGSLLRAGDVAEPPKLWTPRMWFLGAVAAGETKYLAGAAALALSGAGALSAQRRLAGAGAVALSASAVARAKRRIAGAAAIQTATTASLHRTARLTGASAVTLGGTGAARRLRALQGSTGLSLAGVGALRAVRRLLGMGALGLTGVGRLRAVRRLAGATGISLSAAATLYAEVTAWYTATLHAPRVSGAVHGTTATARLHARPGQGDL